MQWQFQQEAGHHTTADLMAVKSLYLAFAHCESLLFLISIL